MSGSTNVGEAFDLQVTRAAAYINYAGIVKLVEAEAEAVGQAQARLTRELPRGVWPSKDPVASAISYPELAQ